MVDIGDLFTPVAEETPEVTAMRAALLDVLFDRMPIGMAVFDSDLRLRRVNAMWQSFLDRAAPLSAKQAMVGMGLYDLIARDQQTETMVGEALAGRPVRASDLLIERDGVLSYWDVAITPLRDHVDTLWGVMIVVSDASDRVFAYRMLEEKEVQFQRAVETERGRIARELHDAVTQTLFSASLIADVLPRLWEKDVDEGKRRLSELRQLSRGALAEMRSLLLELRPSALEGADLRDLLRQLTEAFIGRARVPVDFQIVGTYRPLPPDVQLLFYRVAQEALSNIFKHANASQVSVGLTFADEVELLICDDGRGFDFAAIGADHFGLAIMRERVHAVGADLMIETAPMQGTCVQLRWGRGQNER